MAERDYNVNRLAAAAAIALGVVIPLSALLAAAWELPSETQTSIWPFGWQRVIVVHMIAALPLSLVLAHGLTVAFAWLKHSVVTALLIVVAAGLAAWTVRSGATAGDHTAFEQMRFVGCLVVRVGWCVALQLPWFVAALNLLGTPFTLTGRGWLAVSLLGPTIAFLVPVVFIVPLMERQALKAERLIGERRVQAGIDAIHRLRSSGSSRTFSFMDARSRRQIQLEPRKAMELLNGEVDRLTRQIESYSDNRSSTNSQQLERAMANLSLDRVADAKTILTATANSDPRAATVLAQLYQEEERWNEAEFWYQKGLDLTCGPNLEISSGEIANIQRHCYEGLAASARELKQYDLAQQYYETAMAELPDQEPHFRSLLARHFSDGGRLNKAHEQETKAHQANPDAYERPSAMNLYWAIPVMAVVVYLVIQDFVLPRMWANKTLNQ